MERILEKVAIFVYSQRSTPHEDHRQASDCGHQKGYESDCVGDQWSHVAVKTEVVREVEAQSTANVVELEVKGNSECA